MKKIILPKILFFLYIPVNLFFGIGFVSDGFVEFEGIAYSIDADYIDLLIYIFSFCALFFLANILLYIGRKSETILSRKEWNWLGNSVFLICLINIFFTYKYSINIAGKPNAADIGAAIKIISFLLSPDYLVPFFLCLRFHSASKYLLISILFLCSMMIRGWMGGVLILLVSWIINYTTYRTIWPKNIIRYGAAFSAILFISLPALQFMKHYFRGGEGDLLQSLIANYSTNLFDLYSESLSTIFLRFQAFDLYGLILKNQGEIMNLYDAGLITPSYEDNMPSYFFGLWSGGNPFGQVFAGYLKGESVEWATHTLALGWILIEGLPFFLYSILIIPLVFWMSNIVGGLPFKQISFFYLMLFYWHGWMSAFFNIILYLIIFSVILKLIKILGKVRL